jgi:hypothetical protein
MSKIYESIDKLVVSIFFVVIVSNDELKSLC